MDTKLLSFLVATAVASASAATIQWTNTAGGDWNTTVNWSPNQVPTGSDTAVITNDGTYTVNLNVNTTVSGLFIGGEDGTQTASMSSKTLIVTGPATVGSNGRLNWSGTLNTPGSLMLHGSMVWSNGQITAGSTLVVDSNATLTTVGNLQKSLQGSLTNAGTIIATGTGAINGPGRLYNLSTGLVELQEDSGPGVGLLSIGLIVNDGTLRKSGGSGISIISATEFTNNSIIDAQTGVLRLDKITLGENSSYLGSGTNAIYSGTMNGAFTSQNLSLGLSSFPGFSGNLGGTGTLHGWMDWSEGTITAGAGLQVGPDGTLNLVSGPNKNLQGTLTNAGTVKIAGSLALTPSAIFHNLPSGLITVKTSGSVALDRGLVINDGTLRKSENSDVSFITSEFINNGIVDAEIGTIKFASVSIGYGPVILGEGCSFVGSGTNLIAENVTLAGTFYSENLLIQQGTFSGKGTLEGFMTWESAIISPGASLTISTNSSLRVVIQPSTIVQGNLTNAGLVYFESTRPAFIGVYGGLIHNLTGGTFDFQGDGWYSASGSAQFINDGLHMKSGGVGVTTIPTQLPFINNGTVLAQSGTLLFNGSLTNPAGTLAVSGGTIASDTPLLLPGGLVTGSGTIEAPSITSAAVVRPGATNAVLTISGNYTQELGGSLEFDIGGSEPGTNHSQVIITGDAHLNGSLGVTLDPGYSPAVGSSNVLLRAASVNGQFDCQNGFFLLGENKRLQADYSPTNLTVTTIAAPDPVAPALNISKADQLLICWPTEFEGYGLYSQTNLQATNWSLVPGATNKVMEVPVGSSKFYQLIKQP